MSQTSLCSTITISPNVATLIKSSGLLKHHNNNAVYREQVRQLGVCCRDNNLFLNVNKTKEMIVDFQATHVVHIPLHISGTTVEKVQRFKFRGVHITNNVSWSLNTMCSLSMVIDSAFTDV